MTEKDLIEIAAYAFDVHAKIVGLACEIGRLRAAIRKHRDARGHDRCWENNLELYAVLPESEPTEPELPPHDEFLERCEAYYQEENRRRAP